MKKTYFRPETEVVDIACPMLLAGSDTDKLNWNPDEGTDGIEVREEDGDIDDDDIG